MSKLIFDSEVIVNKLNPKLSSTVEELQRIINYSNRTVVPPGFAASEYRSSIDKLNNLVRGLQNVESDLQRAVRNFEEVEVKALKNANDVESDKKTELAQAVVKID